MLLLSLPAPTRPFFLLKINISGYKSSLTPLTTNIKSLNSSLLRQKCWLVGWLVVTCDTICLSMFEENNRYNLRLPTTNFFYYIYYYWRQIKPNITFSGTDFLYLSSDCDKLRMFYFILIEGGVSGLRMSLAPSCQLSSLLPGKIIRECQKTAGWW